ncbi:lipocalin family protein [Spirosoma sp. SC4-14]|uniref:lipocalin family protein n=1 Tax=Spirosoma sp. SC4-14 TaxID=3128900 RepID=UPI0030CD2714
MRKNYLLRSFAWALIMVLPLAFSNCSKSSNDSVTPSSVEGNWKITSMKINPAVDTGIFGTIDDFYQLFVALGAETCLKELTLTLNSNGTTSSNNPASCQDGTDELSDVAPVSNNGKWVMSGNKLTITNSDGTIENYDTAISGNTLTLTAKKQVGDKDGNPVNATMTIVLTRA